MVVERNEIYKYKDKRMERGLCQTTDSWSREQWQRKYKFRIEMLNFINKKIKESNSPSPKIRFSDCKIIQLPPLYESEILNCLKVLSFFGFLEYHKYEGFFIPFKELDEQNIEEIAYTNWDRVVDHKNKRDKLYRKKVSDVLKIIKKNKGFCIDTEEGVRFTYDVKTKLFRFFVPPKMEKLEKLFRFTFSTLLKDKDDSEITSIYKNEEEVAKFIIDNYYEYRLIERKTGNPLKDKFLLVDGLVDQSYDFLKKNKHEELVR